MGRNDDVGIEICACKQSQDMLDGFLGCSIDLPLVFGARVQRIGPGVGRVGKERERVDHQDEMRAPILRSAPVGPFVEEAKGLSESFRRTVHNGPEGRTSISISKAFDFDIIQAVRAFSLNRCCETFPSVVHIEHSYMVAVSDEGRD